MYFIFRLSCDTWDRNSTKMELNRGVLWLHCCWRWCCLCERSHNAHVVAQVKRVSRAHLLISGRQNVAYFSARSSCGCVFMCDKMFNLMARGINNLQLQLLPVRHTHTHTFLHWHLHTDTQSSNFTCLFTLFSLRACFVGQSKVSPTYLRRVCKALLFPLANSDKFMMI